MQTLESELQQVRESNSHQKKRVIEMMMSLMKDLADIGTAIGSEFKASKRRYSCELDLYSNGVNIYLKFLC